MTTSKARLQFNPAAFEKLANSPQVVEKLDEVAADFVRLLQAGWPDSIGDQTAKDTEKFQHEEHDRVFVVVKTKRRDGRPVRVVLINHPYAVAHQAKTGFVTQAAAAVGYTLSH